MGVSESKMGWEPGMSSESARGARTQLSPGSTRTVPSEGWSGQKAVKNIRNGHKVLDDETESQKN